MNSAAAGATASTASPLRRFAKASTVTCAAEATVYGQCILATYTDVRKDICKAEFEKFGACMRKAVCIHSATTVTQSFLHF
jgi:NADH dehydrogenase [ubiquinone] 1 alpha subcomplex assembly factor 8